jgi:hypothetical protein
VRLSCSVVSMSNLRLDDFAQYGCKPLSDDKGHPVHPYFAELATIRSPYNNKPHIWWSRYNKAWVVLPPTACSSWHQTISDMTRDWVQYRCAK